VDAKKVYVIPVNADLNKFANTITPEIRNKNIQALGLEKFSKIIIATGRLKQEKDFPVLIRAMKKVCSAHPDAGLCILGEGSEREKIVSEIQKLGLTENVILPGAVSHEAVAQYLAVCDVYVMCSVFEGLPIALAEACASGKPVVSTAFAAAPELVVEGETGFCVPIKGIDEMAARIIYLLDNPKKAKTMGLAGREYVLEMFNEDHNIRGVVKMWQETGRAVNGSK
jgi:glycosyltransferase involved in cell wall biosynthesis